MYATSRAEKHNNTPEKAQLLKIILIMKVHKLRIVVNKQQTTKFDTHQRKYCKNISILNRRNRALK